MPRLLRVTGWLMFLIIMTACSQSDASEERAKEYIKLWNEQNFSEMYTNYVAPSVKETVKEEDYINRYQAIYRDLQVDKLKVTLLEEGGSKEAIPIQVSMNTLAGPVSFEKDLSLVKEEVDGQEEWFVNWNPSYILPDMAQGDKVRITTTEEAKRGQIFDRNGKPLAVNKPGFTVGVEAGVVDGQAEVKEKLAQLLNITTEAIDEKLQQSWVQPGNFVPLGTVAGDNKEILDQLKQIEGVQTQEMTTRHYPYKEALGHLTGYIGPINGEELEKMKAKGYTAQDEIGKRGLEEVLEEDLRSRDGKRIYIEKENGETVTVAETKAKNGKDIKLAIDAEMQKTLYDQMEGKPGTAAAVHPTTGEVMALVSSPGFDPNEFTQGISSSRYKELEEDPDKPLFNRFSAAYSPGSTMKLITTAIGLTAGTLDPTKERPITGLHWQKDESWGDYYVTRVSDIGQPVNLREAFVHSDNIYFAQTALEMGADKMEAGLQAFGFGEKLPFAYPVRQSQISNSGQLDKEVLLSDTGYGQGEVLTSMVHLASAYGGVINNGTMMTPQLYADTAPKAWKTGLVSQENADLLKKHLRSVVQEGTAQEANIPGRTLAGKTGTAELKAGKEAEGEENGLFVVYDQQNPDFVLAVMMEHVKESGGSKEAIRTAVQFFNHWK